MAKREADFDATEMSKHPNRPKPSPTGAEVDRFARHGIERGPNKFEQGFRDRQSIGAPSPMVPSRKPDTATS